MFKLLVLHSSEPGWPDGYPTEVAFVVVCFLEGSINDLAEALIRGDRGVSVLIGERLIARATIANYSFGGSRLPHAETEPGERRVLLSLKGITPGEVPVGAELVSG